MEIKILTENLVDEYDDFLLEDERTLFYVSSKYLGFLEEVLDCQREVLLVISNDVIIGCLPLMSKKGPLGIVYNSLPFYGSNGGIISSSKEATDLLIKRYNQIISDEKVASSNYIENPLHKIPIEDKINFNEEDFRTGQLTPLTFQDHGDIENKDLLMGALHTKTRNTIRKAVKNEVLVRIDNEAIDYVKREHIEGMARINGKAKSDLFFDQISKSFVPGKDYNIFVAEKGSTIIAAVLVFYFNRTVEYFVPVTSDGYKHFQPASLVIYEAMLAAMNKGYRYWNWGGTWESQSGVYSFKNRWNTINIKYKYYITVTNKKIYGTKREELLKHYEGFYVMPFHKL